MTVTFAALKRAARKWEQARAFWMLGESGYATRDYDDPAHDCARLLAELVKSPPPTVQLWAAGEDVDRNIKRRAKKRQTTHHPKAK